MIHRHTLDSERWKSYQRSRFVFDGVAALSDGVLYRPWVPLPQFARPKSSRRPKKNRPAAIRSVR